MRHSQAFFSAPSDELNEKSTTEDAVKLAGALQALEGRVAQMEGVKRRLDKSEEVADCGDAIRCLKNCSDAVFASVSPNHSPGLS